VFFSHALLIGVAILKPSDALIAFFNPNLLQVVLRQEAKAAMDGQFF